MEYVETFQDLPYVLEIEVTTSESPFDFNNHIPNGETEQQSDSSSSSSNHLVNSSSSSNSNSNNLGSISKSPESSTTAEVEIEQIGEKFTLTSIAATANVEGSDNQTGAVDETLAIGSESECKAIVPISLPQCSSSTSQPNGLQSDSTAAAAATGVTQVAESCNSNNQKKKSNLGGIPVSTIQWASSSSSKRKLVVNSEEQNKKKQLVQVSKEVSAESNNKVRRRLPLQTESNVSESQVVSKAVVVHSTRSNDDTEDDDVVYIGEYRPKKVIQQARSTVPATVPVLRCPYCSCSCRATTALLSKKLAAYEWNLFGPTPRWQLNPMRWRGSYPQQINTGRQYSLTNTQTPGSSSGRAPTLFPEPPEDEWIPVRVHHQEPKRLGINIRSYETNTKQQQQS